MVAVSNLSYAQARDIAQRELDRTCMSKEQKDALVNYLAAIPMTSRQALRNREDGDGHITTMVSQVPQSAEEMAKFVPVRTPRFQPGDKLKGHDLQLDTLLGMGGFAEVWKAYPTEFNRDRPVALKFCFDKALMAGLKNEIRVLDQIGGYDPAEDKDFVQALADQFHRRPAVSGFRIHGWRQPGELGRGVGGARPQVSDVISVMKMAARAMQVAHESKDRAPGSETGEPDDVLGRARQDHRFRHRLRAGAVRARCGRGGRYRDHRSAFSPGPSPRCMPIR